MAEGQATRWASRALFFAVKGAPERQWQIAQKCGMTPSTVSALLRGYSAVKPGDERIIKLATAVGLAPERAFSKRQPGR